MVQTCQLAAQFSVDFFRRPLGTQRRGEHGVLAIAGLDGWNDVMRNVLSSSRATVIITVRPARSGIITTNIFAYLHSGLARNR